MVEDGITTLNDLARHVGRYPEEAFLFVREALGFVTEKLHGPETPAHRALHEYVMSQEMDWGDLATQYLTGTLPEPVVDAIDAAGGCEKLNRHVGGHELCWGLRDYALSRWGMLSRAVLNNWNIRSTDDFGRIVFGFIDCDLMQKQSDDTLEDFQDIYSFEEAFDEPFLAVGVPASGDFPGGIGFDGGFVDTQLARARTSRGVPKFELVIAHLRDLDIVLNKVWQLSAIDEDSDAGSI